MEPATSASNTTSQSFSCPVRECNQCGATDKKMSVCGRCHIEQYCSQTCQAAAWPSHKEVCVASSKKKTPSSAEKIRDVAMWSGKKFGELRGYRIIDNNVRILSHTGGFAVFLPEDLWRKLDYEVPLAFPKNEDAECWIAEKGFAFCKFDIDPSVLEDEDKDYASEALATALNKIENFVKKNFLENAQAYPGRSYYTHGSFKDDPGLRPIRLRMGGNFQYQF